MQTGISSLSQASTEENVGEGDSEVKKLVSFLKLQPQTKLYVRNIEKHIEGVGPRPIAIRSIAQTLAGSDFVGALKVINKWILLNKKKLS